MEGLNKEWMLAWAKRMMERSQRLTVQRRRLVKYPDRRLIEEVVDEVPVASGPVVIKCPYCEGKGLIPYTLRKVRGGDKPPVDYPMNARCNCAAGVRFERICLSYRDVFGTYPSAGFIEAEARVVYEEPALPQLEAKTEGVVAWDMTGEDDAEAF